MRRYAGEDLPEECRIAVIANDALGNYVVVSPLLQLLHKRHSPVCLDFYSGLRTQQFWQNNSLISQGVVVSECGEPVPLKPYDLVVNVERAPWAKGLTRKLALDSALVVGPCLNETGVGDLGFGDDAVGALAQDSDWASEGILSRHSILNSAFIGEILCRLSYLSGSIPPYCVPTKAVRSAVPDVLIAPAASLPEKLWDAGLWLRLVRWLASKGLSIGLIGASPEQQRRYWYGESTETKIIDSDLVQDLRGQFTLPEVAGAVQQAKLCVTLDNGVMHLACSANTATVGLFREGYHRLWAPPVVSLRVLHPGLGKTVESIPLHSVQAAIEEALSG